MLLLALLSVAHADPGGPPVGLAPVRASGPVTVDGRLDEPAWSSAAVATGFMSYNPEIGEPDPDVEARILFDDEGLYFGFVVETGARRPTHALVPRDDTESHDWVEVLLDTYQDGQRAFGFRVNPDGVQADGIYEEVDGDLYGHSLSWDGDWRSAATHSEHGYVVEIAIPWRTLRYPRAPEQAWRVLLQHYVPVPWTLNTWPPMRREATGLLSQSVELGPLAPPPAHLPLEVQPTLTGAWGLLDQELAPGVSPWSDAPNPGLDPGLNLKAGLSSSLTLDLTLNPDFSQVESDADQVTANVKYPLYYPEKRPFFLESADLFATPGEVFYSRSVVDPLVGARLTGRVGSAGVGLLTALDDAPAASTVNLDYASGEALPTWSEADVAGARSAVSVARLRWNPGAGDALGAIYADKELLRADGEVWANRVLAVDGRAELGGQYSLSSQVLGSSTDFADGSRRGIALGYQAIRSGEKTWFLISNQFISRDFRAEDGFFTEVGRISGTVDAQLLLDDAGPFRFASPELTVSAQWSTEGRLTAAEANPFVQLVFPGGLYVLAAFPVQRERFFGQDFDLWSVDGSLDYPIGDRLNLSLGWDVGPQPHYDAATLAELYRGFSYEGDVELNARLFGRLALTWEGTTQQFLEEATGPLVYSTLLNRVVLNLNITRPLSVRLVGEHNSFERSLATSALLAWEPRYGRAIYVGASDTEDRAAGEAVERAVFTKVSWLLAR